MMMLMVAVIFAAMLLDDRLSPEFELGFLVFAAGPCLVAWRLNLRGGPFEDGDPDAMVFLAMCVIVVCWGAAAVCVVAFVGEVALGVYFWVSAMGTAGYLGYGLAVDARYEQLVAIKRLVGRRTAAVCSPDAARRTLVLLISNLDGHRPAVAGDDARLPVLNFIEHHCV
ncbi:hypothetical protein ACP70R_004043 [Stipagrostis hirtigluma subsp. patula]